MKYSKTIQAVLACCILVAVRGQSTVEFLLANTDQPNDGLLVDTDRSTAPSLIKSCNKLCVNGMWALYTLAKYGEASPSTVTVYPVIGGSRSTCVSGVNSVLKQINSMRRIAPPASSLGPPVGTGVEFCLKKYFINTPGPADTACLTDPAMAAAAAANTINSFAIGTEATPMAYLICNGTDPTMSNCACAVPANGPFLVPDVAKWPKGPLPLLKIGLIKPVAIPVVDVDCMAAQQPVG